MSKLNSFSKRIQYLVDFKKIIPANLVKAGIGDSAQISKWLSGSIDNPQRKTLLKIADYFGCDINWLAEGLGEPFPQINERINGELGRVTSGGRIPERTPSTQKIRATIEPGPARKDRTNAKPTDVPFEEQSDSLNEEEAIDQTRYVLRSDTVYRGALLSNIRAFYQGVKREEELADVDITMIAMQEQLDRQEKTMNRMEKLLEKFLGETTTKEKTQTG